MPTLRVSGNLSQQVVKFDQVSRSNGDKVLQGVCGKIITEIERRNHIWLGRMIANWNVGINSVDEHYDPNRRDKERRGAMTARNLPILAKAKMGDVVNITNATPHAGWEEFGTPARDAHPVIRGVTAEIPRYVREVVAKVRSAA